MLFSPKGTPPPYIWEELAIIQLTPGSDGKTVERAEKSLFRVLTVGLKTGRSL